MLKNKNNKMEKNIITGIFIFISCAISSQNLGEVFPKWQEGEMEIHHIFTGGGESVFCILPDGTTLLIDAGDTGPHVDPRKTPISPNDSRNTGEWIARYIQNRLNHFETIKINYAFLTHFHNDHMGGVYENYKKTSTGGDYYLSGITEVYEHVPYVKMIDRNWPSYDYPKQLSGKELANYREFLNYNKKNNDMIVERFISGSNKQFTLVNHPEKYPEFEIRNIVSNGEVWTGEENKTKKFFPEGKVVDENKCCAGIRISYGDFDYFNGGDITGRIPLGAESWKDIETPVGEALGVVEVCEANHHAWIDAMNESFLSLVKPQIIVQQINHVTHFNLSVLRSMTNKEINPNIKHIIPTNIPEISRRYYGEEELDKITGEGGHVVIKVKPKGKEYSVFLLTTENESFRIESKYGPFQCQ